MNKKNSHKENLNIVQDFVDIVNKNDLSELEYEAEHFKIKIKNNLNNSPSPQKTIVKTPKANISENNVKIEEKIEKLIHPQSQVRKHLLN